MFRIYTKLKNLIYIKKYLKIKINIFLDDKFCRAK